MLRLCTALALACFCISLAAADDKRDEKKDDKKPEATKLEGTYTITSGERDGKPLPEAEFKGAVVTIKGNKMFGTDKDKKEFFAATFTLDTGAKPWKINMVSISPKEGEKAAGVVEATGDTVKICYNLPGGDAPTEFKTKGKQQCFTLMKTGK